MAGKKMPDTKDIKSGLSRREFTRNAALLAVAAAAPIELSAKSLTTGQTQTPPAAPQLNAETEGQYQAIIQKYGSKLSDDQKADIKRILAAGQKSTESLRAFPLDNADEPANIFCVTEPKKR